MKNRGFTLIELIVVMAIIAVLVLLAAPRFLGYTKDANVTATKQDTKVLSDAAEMYHVDKGVWPIDKNKPTIPFGIGGVDYLHPIKEGELKKGVSSLKNAYEDYGIVTTGQHAGKVFALDSNKQFKANNDFGLLSDLNLRTYQLDDFRASDDGSIILHANRSIAGLYFRQGHGIELKPSTDYTLSYTYQKIEGKLVSFGGSVGDEFVESTEVHVDGVFNSNDYHDASSAYIRDDQLEHEVVVNFRTVNRFTTGKHWYYQSLFIQPNRFSSTPVTVLIRDVNLVES